jgi:ATP-binding cassette, subfamily B, multidrug efflux pump
LQRNCDRRQTHRITPGPADAPSGVFIWNRAMFGFFERLIDPFPTAEPTRPPSRLFAFLWHYTKEVWPFVAALTVLTASVSATQIVIFSYLGDVVDWFTTANRATFLQENATTLWVMAAVILIVLPVLSLLHTLLMHQTIFGNFPMLIRWQAHRYMLGQSYGFYQDEFAGRVATKVMQTALGVRESVMKMLDVFVYVLVYFGGALVLVWSLNGWLVVAFLGWLAYYLAMMRIILPRMSDISEKQSDARSMMTGRVVDSYTNILTVKLFGHARREEGYARDAMKEFMATVHPQMRYGSHLNIWLDLGNGLLLFAVGAIGIGQWLDNALTAGGLAVAIGLVLRLEGMSHWIMWEMAGLFENIGMAEDGMKTLSKERAVRDRPDAAPLMVKQGAVAFNAVDFHYGNAKGVLESLDLWISAGEKIGIVGRSGAGKSTLINVLLRLYDIEGGSVTIDGQDISAVTQDSLRGAIGVVTQDTSLLHRSVRDNIAYGRPDATEDEIIAAARKANAWEFVQDLADPQGRKGLDAHVGERGVKLSGGQRQRIAIARIMLKDAPILVLDEATSALDSEVEQAIQDNLFTLMEGKTVLVIAHRLSTIAALDRLVVLDKGRIVEQGTHAGLVAAGGLYADLWARQSGGFIALDDDAEELAKAAKARADAEAREAAE